MTAALLTLAIAACSRHDARLEQHKKKLESLGATTKVVSDAWLSGHVSGTYTRTTLDQTFYLVEQERTALASTPAMLHYPRGAALSQDAERLARLIALIISDVQSADGPSARQRLATLPLLPRTRP
jgi:hypothetical protein